jgi:hypothetical protein
MPHSWFFIRNAPRDHTAESLFLARAHYPQIISTFAPKSPCWKRPTSPFAM